MGDTLHRKALSPSSFIIPNSAFLQGVSVPDFLTNLLAARDQIAQNLADMTADPKPNYKIDGQVVSWQGLLDSYLSQMEKLNAQIAAADPFEIHSRGFTGP
jgi:hypothetical protein